MKIITTLLMLFISIISFAQTSLYGNITDEYGQPIPGVSVQLKGTDQRTISDFDGFFAITTNKEYPYTLEISSVGFEPVTEVVNSGTIEVNITLKEISFLDELVVAASRAPERIFESPVSIERYGINDVKAAPSADFYAGLENIKGVDVNTNSLTFQSINTRGFATFTNTRFVQLIDGMDNVSPSLNFALGNLIGVNELDVQNIELLPGASSALYGANAFNGILFMNTKNPFDHQGISTYFKTGITSQEAAGDNEFYDVGLRMAKAFGDKFAAKVNFAYLRGTDWYASNRDNVLNPGESRAEDPAYDGLNVYGDEVRTALPGIGFVSRTGYDEADLTDYEAESIKFDGSLHYRPFGDDFEIIYAAKVGKGQTMFQDSNRFSLKNFLLQQHKLEVRNDNFFIRSYITAEDAGDAYDTRFAGININRRWKSDQQWFGEYAFAFQQAFSQTGSEELAHSAARDFADTGRFEPGTAEFQNAFNSVTSDPDFETGARFISKTQFTHHDANYNFSHLLGDFADIQIGGSFREYNLISDGTIYTDFDGSIDYSEFGIYSQIQKKLIDDRLKLTGSVRYDKSELFDGNYSPRFSVGYTLGRNRNRNIRASIQTGFRNPTTQDLFIGLDIGEGAVVGSAEANLDRYTRVVNGTQISGRAAYENSYTANSVRAFLQTGGTDTSVLEIANPDIVKPEKVTAIELGYRADFGKLLLDVSGYYNMYQDFIATVDVASPLSGDVGTTEAENSLRAGNFAGFQTITNSTADINSYGAVFGISARVFGNYELNTSYTFAEQDFDQSQDPGFRTSFNTPRHKFKAMFGNENLLRNFGFNTAVRWSTDYIWESAFAVGEVPSFTVFDAQINYRIPALKAKIKLGGTNLTGEEYFTALGTGNIGSQYYIGLYFNNL
ncbi:TonB-dependent receptor [Aquimarina brevivitae]|uniref:Outer membrane receptor protein involved in Fe transport n=1 Tax=Aquimarina brevivitae TaxID=323412 RepID=A0A4Q7PHV0_9FLAO|nr:TonB-dependent receptor [Aquimarina brevivitae]RZS99380.1 outer membrane receptor protein involved in Fe transport [Aquimarina brevivitae]